MNKPVAPTLDQLAQLETACREIATGFQHMQQPGELTAENLGFAVEALREVLKLTETLALAGRPGLAQIAERMQALAERANGTQR